ncbi:FMN-binding protein [Streptomyces fuscigenes]|uniref:FMN-binding protein n=1 Tax=Streptomyces fuscigenes TaxID=1528880 RepID=UPI001F40D315|nr:FMN-binding protein [Streptomyces fuscigenes]MCF3960118.1 FMN-binding protein [Streptomyces fuscigenes]
MRRALVVTTGISTVVVGLLAVKPHQPAVLSAPASPQSSAPTPRGGATPRPGGSGTFTGSSVDTQYGPVQIQARLTHGRITSITVLRAPDRSGRDQQIAAYALPRLTREAMGAQSAHIDAVSGASYTSQGYVQSLQSALDQAHA